MQPGWILQRPSWSRALVGVVALALASPMPWVVGRLGMSFTRTVVIAVALAVVAMPMGKWAAGSWTTAALVGAVANVFWFYSLVVDPASAPWLSLFLAVPYLAFTVAGCIGFFRERRPRRWAGVLVPPVLYLFPFFAADLINEMRFPR